MTATRSTATVTAFGETLSVEWTIENVWNAGVFGRHATAREALRGPVEGLISNSGDDPADYDIDEILDGIVID